jgi:hypothetical protein
VGQGGSGKVDKYGAHVARPEEVTEVVGDGGGVVGRALWLGGVIPVNLLVSKEK